MSAAPTVEHATPIERVFATFGKYYYLPDPGIVSVSLGALAANLLPGPPVWLMLVGPPGSGKTAILNAMGGLPNVHVAGTLTEASLLSGTARKERAADATGGLLRLTGDFGILILKDFTSILSMNRDTRAATLAALREVYDGSWTRLVGTDGGKALHWQGKLGLLAGVTQSIDSHHAVTASMGERFLLHRLPISDPELQVLAAYQNASRTEEVAAETGASVRALFASGFDSTPLVRTDSGEVGRLGALAAIAAHARSSVERDGRTREVVYVHDSEMPARLTLSLLQLDSGMAALGIAAGERWRLIQKTALDCIPNLRRRALLTLRDLGTPANTSELAERLDHPTSTVRLALEDLTAHRVLRRIKTGQGSADLWELSPATAGRFSTVGTVYEKSGEL